MVFSQKLSKTWIDWPERRYFRDLPNVKLRGNDKLELLVYQGANRSFDLQMCMRRANSACQSKHDPREGTR